MKANFTRKNKLLKDSDYLISFFEELPEDLFSFPNLSPSKITVDKILNYAKQKEYINKLTKSVCLN